MHTREVVGFVLIPLALLMAAWLIAAAELWSRLSSQTVPWLLSAVAIATLLLAAACLTTGRAPSDLPTRWGVAICAGIQAIYAAGLVIDGISYGVTADWIASAGEWLGFGLILTSVFLGPRRFTNGSAGPGEASGTM